MVEEVLYFLVPFFSLALIAIGFAYRESFAGIIGGLLLFLFGLMIVIDPLPVLSTTLNLVLGNICWAYGAYLWVVGAYELLQSRGIFGGGG